MKPYIVLMAEQQGHECYRMRFIAEDRDHAIDQAEDALRDFPDWMILGVEQEGSES